MGIRVHKCLGYGLNNLKKNDPRINPLGYIGKDTSDEDKEDTWVENNFITFCKSQGKDALFLYRALNKPDFQIYNHLIYDPDEIKKNFLMITPPWHKDWYRYDDIIDYTEESGIAKFKLKILDCGIWPYIAGYNDLRPNYVNDLEPRIKNQLMHEFWYSVRSGKNETGKQKKLFQKCARTYAKKLGFKEVREAKKYIVPAVPEIVELFCKWLCLFNDENTIYDLKPMICTYWM